MIRLLPALALVLATPAAAQIVLDPPAERTVLETTPLGSHRVATGPFADTLPTEVAEGAITREIWRVPAPETTTLRLLEPLRAALEADGWEIVYDCHTKACGGFDFRFEIDVAPAPEMFVDLADFRYLSARKDGAWTDLVVSLSGDLGFIQVTAVRPDAVTDPIVKSASNAPPHPGLPAGAPAPDLTGGMSATLTSRGSAVLDDLEFETGSTALTDRSVGSLQELATFLEANPRTTIALVGHTDAEGGAAGNLAISQQRADSARDLLVGTYGIAPERVQTRGLGFFSPIAPNDTEAGRQANRR
ncbi:MAG: OmpA family protein, partial [Pseudomonadota bacterium]